MDKRRPYPSDESDEEWCFAAPFDVDGGRGAQRRYDVREMFNALRRLARAGAAWRMLPTNFPPWEAVSQQTQRWLRAECFEAMVQDLRSVLRVAQGRQGQPSAVILDGRTLQSTCESGPRAGYAWLKAQTGEQGHMAVDTLGHLPTRVIPAKNLRKPRGMKASNCRSSNCRRRRKALSCCRADGLSSAVSDGSIAFEDSRVTTSACPKHSLVCISSSLPCSC